MTRTLILVGAGTPSSTGTLSADNLATMTPMFVGAASYDYHLLDGSPAIGTTVAPGMADAMSLVAAFEYAQPTAAAARASQHDVGAYEHGAMLGTPDGGVVVGMDAGLVAAATIADGGTSSDASTASKAGSGCGCSLGARGPITSPALVLACLLAWGARRRRGAAARR